MIGIKRICLGSITRAIRELLYWAGIKGRIRPNQKSYFGLFFVEKAFMATNF